VPHRPALEHAALAALASRCGQTLFKLQQRVVNPKPKFMLQRIIAIEHVAQHEELPRIAHPFDGGGGMGNVWDVSGV
jgi:hypothetical protein